MSFANPHLGFLKEGQRADTV